MSRLRILRKNMSKKTPDPTIAPDAPCWCGSGVAYADCHRLYDQIYTVPKGVARDPDCPT